MSHWICANRNSKTSTRLSTRPFHSPWSEPAPDPDLLAASIPALRSPCHCGGARIINSPDLPSHCVFGSGEARGNRISSKGATPMLDKKGRRFFFTHRQMQQLVLTNDRLRQSNGSAWRELRRVGRSNLTTKKYIELDHQEIQGGGYLP